jgi:Leucine-rich repeat (LRR) protein
MKAKKTLTIDHPILAEGIHQLKDSSLSEIHLSDVYVGHHLESGYFVKDYSIPVTIETINPGVEILSLKSCGLTDDLARGITEFKSLKALYLDGNFLTDQTAILLSGMEKLRVISLALNEDISNNALQTLLAMPNLEELDVSFNDKIDSDGGKLILNSDKKIRVKVSQTSIPLKMQLEIKKR